MTYKLDAGQQWLRDIASNELVGIKDSIDGEERFIPFSNVNSVSGSVIKIIWTGTKAQYDAIVTKDSSTQYNTDDGVYVGTTLVSGGGANANFQQAGTGAVVRTSQSKMRDTVHARDFGAVLDGVTDDTSAFQLAINYCKSNPSCSVLRIDGSMVYNPAAISYAGATTRIKLEVNGSLKPTTTIVVTDAFEIEGVGGALSANAIQFGFGGNCCQIYAPAGNIPVIKLSGANAHSLKNINIYGCYQGIYADGATALGALARLENVNILQNVAGGTPLVVDAFFWLIAEKCRFLTSTTGGGEKSILLTNTSIAYSQAGLIFFRDCITAGMGVSANPTVGVVSNVLFDNHHHEALPDGEDFFYAKSGCHSIEFRSLGISDSLGTSYAFDVAGVTGFRVIGGYPHSFRNPPESMTIDADVPTNGINVTREIGSRNVKASAQHRGALVGRLLSRGHIATAPMGIGSPISVTMPTGVQGNITYTAGQTAPDGTATATKVEATGAGAPTAQFVKTLYQAGRAVVPGDRIVLFAMVKMLDTTTGGNSDTGILYCGFIGLGQPAKAITGYGRTTSEATTAGLDHAIADDGWMPAVAVIEATASGNPDVVIGNVIRKASAGYLIWKLSARFIPASMGFSDADMVRLTQAYGPMHGANSGVVSVMEHQPFRTGLDTTANRPSAASAGNGSQFYDTTLGKPIWSNGTVWKDAAGNTV